MGRLWSLIAFVHSLAGPGTMLLYPLYASIIAIESTTKLDDEQWLAYWIIYSFLTLLEMLLQPILNWIPIWYDMKLAFVAWLVLPHFRGAAFIYHTFVRDILIKRLGEMPQHPNPNPDTLKPKKKFVQFVNPKKGEHEAY